MLALTRVSFHTANYSGSNHRLVCAEVAVPILSKSWDDPKFLIQPSINLCGYNLQTREPFADTIDTFRGLLVKRDIDKTIQ
jgi:hypothetical protein